MHLRLSFGSQSHPRYDIALPDRVALPHQQFIIQSVCAQEGVVVLDDDQIAVGRQSVTGIDHLSGRGSPYVRAKPSPRYRSRYRCLRRRRTGSPRPLESATARWARAIPAAGIVARESRGHRRLRWWSRGRGCSNRRIAAEDPGAGGDGLAASGPVVDAVRVVAAAGGVASGWRLSACAVTGRSVPVRDATGGWPASVARDWPSPSGVR